MKDEIRKIGTQIHVVFLIYHISQLKVKRHIPNMTELKMIVTFIFSPPTGIQRVDTCISAF